jgi:hypothetical protein
LCGVLLLRGYRGSRARLLLWSGLCFVGLTMNNILLFVDLIVVPQVDLSVPRRLVAVIALGMLVYGLVWEARER